MPYDWQANINDRCTISELEQDHNSVTVNLSGRMESFSAVIGADGVGSQVRKLAFDEAANENCYRQTDTFVAYFSMHVEDLVETSRLQHANKGRIIWIRPVDKNHASCYFIVTSPNNSELRQAAESGCKEEQKTVLERLYQDVDGLRESAVR